MFETQSWASLTLNRFGEAEDKALALLEDINVSKQLRLTSVSIHKLDNQTGLRVLLTLTKL